MSTKLIKHSILMVTYNQESTIERALNSVLKGEVLPYEIIIADDYSTDKTRDKLIKYQNMFSGIIKLVNNPSNIGLIKNINKISKLATGNIVSWLAGDDEFYENTLENINKAIINNELNVENDSFIVVSNMLKINCMTGKKSVFNNYKLQNKNIFKAKIRRGINYREIGISLSLFRQQSPLLEDSKLGYQSDFLWGLDLIFKCKSFIFINNICGIYWQGKGITSKQIKANVYREMLHLNYITSVKYDNYFDIFDQLYLMYDKAKWKFKLDPSLINFVLLIILFLINYFNFPITIRKLDELKSIISIDSIIKVKAFLKKNILLNFLQLIN